MCVWSSQCWSHCDHFMYDYLCNPSNHPFQTFSLSCDMVQMLWGATDEHLLRMTQGDAVETMRQKSRLDDMITREQDKLHERTKKSAEEKIWGQPRTMAMWRSKIKDNTRTLMNVKFFTSVCQIWSLLLSKNRKNDAMQVVVFLHRHPKYLVRCPQRSKTHTNGIEAVIHKNGKQAIFTIPSKGSDVAQSARTKRSNMTLTPLSSPTKACKITSFVAFPQRFGKISPIFWFQTLKKIQKNVRPGIFLA